MPSHEEKRMTISDAIRVIPDFPKKGILFQDVTTILLDPLAFQYCIDLLVDHYKSQKIDVIAGTYQWILVRADQSRLTWPASCRFRGPRAHLWSTACFSFTGTLCASEKARKAAR